MSNGSELRAFLRGAVPTVAEGQNDVLGATSPEFPASLQGILQTTSSQVSYIVDNICSFLIVAYADTLNFSQGEQKVLIYKDGAWDDEFLRGLELRLGTHFLQNSFLKEGGLGQRLIQFLGSKSEILLRENVTLVYDQDRNFISIHKFRDTQIAKVKESGSWKKANVTRLGI